MILSDWIFNELLRVVWYLVVLKHIIDNKKKVIFSEKVTISYLLGNMSFEPNQAL